MGIILNGKVFVTDLPLTIKDLLSLKNINADRVAVEVNYQIVLKKEWDKYLICENDQVEVLQFVGGG